jgi:hypothetical protein
MCGRYRLSRRKEVLAEYFGADFSDEVKNTTVEVAGKRSGRHRSPRKPQGRNEVAR